MHAEDLVCQLGASAERLVLLGDTRVALQLDLLLQFDGGGALGRADGFARSGVRRGDLFREHPLKLCRRRLLGRVALGRCPGPELPERSVREKRWRDFLPQYSDEARKGERVIATAHEE